MHSGFLIHDDIIDGSLMRRGQTTWGLLQQKEGKGLIGINDGLHLYISVQQLLISALNCHDIQAHCLKILKLFGDCANFTCFGQALDILGDSRSSGNAVNGDGVITNGKRPKSLADTFKDFTVDRFVAIAKWKTSYYSFVLPIVAGMFLVGESLLLRWVCRRILIAQLFLIFVGWSYKRKFNFKCQENPPRTGCVLSSAG